MKKTVMASILGSLLLFSLASWAQGKPKAERITNGPLVKAETNNSAEISWSTDAPGSSIVKYGTSPNSLNETAEQPWGGKRESNGDYNHTVWVKNLKPNTTYYFKVETGQGLGTGTEADSRTGQFRTK
jgi:phosphodiesterase/alkaline phosphatase D-like protein